MGFPLVLSRAHECSCDQCTSYQTRETAGYGARPLAGRGGDCGHHGEHGGSKGVPVGPGRVAQGPVGTGGVGIRRVWLVATWIMGLLPRHANLVLPVQWFEQEATTGHQVATGGHSEGYPEHL